MPWRSSRIARDVDAITLSALEMARRRGTTRPEVAWRMIFWLSMANLVFKGVTVCRRGEPELLARIPVPFSLIDCGGLFSGSGLDPIGPAREWLDTKFFSDAPA